MRIICVSTMEAESLIANAINTVRMAEGFAAAGHEVAMLCRAPADGPRSEAELREIYGLIHSFEWTQLVNETGLQLRFAYATIGKLSGQQCKRHA